MIMQKTMIRLLMLAVLLSTIVLTACSSSGGSYSGRTVYHGGVGYGGYYGRPWGYDHPGYIGGIDPDPGFGGGPVAAQMPDMGMPDMDMGMGMDMGGFDF
jgi:predicted small secreted protein